MKIIKLESINSTNTFLKELSKTTDVENFTIVVAKNQTQGRGQHESWWISEPDKNLMFSVFLNNLKLKIDAKKYLNYAVSLAIFETLNSKKIPNLSIKWPNDILSENKKLCGVLIENSITKSWIRNSIIGIGLNVNQEYFPETLTHVTSIKNILNKETDLDSLMVEICNKLKKFLQILDEKNYVLLEEDYLKALYKIHKPALFKDMNGIFFMGIIRKIATSGNVVIELEDETFKEFGVKEISFM